MRLIPGIKLIPKHPRLVEKLLAGLGPGALIDGAQTRSTVTINLREGRLRCLVGFFPLPRRVAGARTRPMIR